MRKLKTILLFFPILSIGQTKVILPQATLPVNVRYYIPTAYQNKAFIVDLTHPELHSISVYTASPAYVLPTKVGVDTFDMYRNDTFYRLPIKIQ